MNVSKLSSVHDLQIHSYWLTDPHALRKVFLIQVVSRDSSLLNRWKIVEGAYTLSRKGEWIWEPSPSNRTIGYTEENYYEHIEEALAVWDQYKGEYMRSHKTPNDLDAD